MEPSVAWLMQQIAGYNKPIFSDNCLEAPSAIRFKGQSGTVILIVLFSTSRLLGLPSLTNCGGFGMIASAAKFLHASGWLEATIKTLSLIGLT